MHIGFVPFYTTTVNDIVWITDATKVLLKFLRCNAPKAPSSWNICSQCKSVTGVEYHHVRPLWTVASEVILKLPPASRHDLAVINRDMVFGNFNTVAKGVPGQTIRMWGAHDEIVPLCCRCHAQETKASNERWKKYLSESYPILWKMRFCKREFETLVSKWYAPGKG